MKLELNIKDISKIKSNTTSLDEKMEIIKCSVTLKGIKGDLAPLLEEWTEYIKMGKGEGEPEETNYEWFMDNVARFYRDNYNGEEPVEMTLEHNGTGLSLKLTYDPTRTSFPTDLDYKAMVDNDNDFMCKIDDEGLSVTRRSGNIDPNNPRIRSQPAMLYGEIDRDMWAGKHENGAETTWTQMKSGLITREEGEQKLQQIRNKEVKSHMSSYVRQLNGMRQRGNVPLQLKHTKIKKNY